MQVRIRPDLLQKLRAMMAADNRSGAFVVAQLIAKAPEPRKK